MSATCDYDKLSQCLDSDTSLGAGNFHLATFSYSSGEEYKIFLTQYPNNASYISKTTLHSVPGPLLEIFWTNYSVSEGKYTWLCKDIYPYNVASIDGNPSLSTLQSTLFMFFSFLCRRGYTVDNINSYRSRSDFPSFDSVKAGLTKVGAEILYMDSTVSTLVGGRPSASPYSPICVG